MTLYAIRTVQNFRADVSHTEMLQQSVIDIKKTRREAKPRIDKSRIHDLREMTVKKIRPKRKKMKCVVQPVGRPTLQTKPSPSIKQQCFEKYAVILIKVY